MKEKKFYEITFVQIHLEQQKNEFYICFHRLKPRRRIPHSSLLYRGCLSHKVSVSRIIMPTLWRKIRPIKLAAWKDTEVMANLWRRQCLRRACVVKCLCAAMFAWMTFVKINVIGLRKVTRKVKFLPSFTCIGQYH